MEIKKTLFKKKKLNIAIQAYDILNQNISINRIVGENFVTDIKTKIITRYFQLKLTYSI